METSKQSYISDRLDQYYQWYDAKAVKSKTKYFRGRVLSAVSAVLIPVIVNLEITILGIDWSNIIVSLLGVAVALLVALEEVFHHKEIWINSRSTAEYLKTQKVLFLHKAQEYSELPEDEAFKLLVLNVEKAIAEENAVTLNVLTRNEEEKAT